jgi:heme exporter protein B
VTATTPPDALAAILARHRHNATRLVQILRETQETLGWLSPATLATLAHGLDLPLAKVTGVAGFYSFFHTEPQGRYRVLWSDNITDRMLGNQDLMAEMCKRLWLEPGHVSEDGLVSVDTTSCTGMCDQGPALLVNYRAVTRMTAERVAEICELIRKEVPLDEWPTEFFRIDSNIRRRDILLAARRRGDWLTAQFFFVMVVSLFPLGIGPEPSMLRSIGPGVVWVAALLATLLSLGRLYAEDHRDGTLEQLMLTPYPHALLGLGKAIAHWIINGIPLLLIAPVLGIQFNLPADALAILVLSLAIGTPILSLLGSIGAALTLGLRGGGALVTLLILPLYVPALIFGAGAVEGAMSGTGSEAHLSLLGAFLLMSLLIAPWVSALALRVSVE